MADIYIKLGYEFQQPYIARANSNAQESTIGRTPSTYSYRVSAAAQQPTIKSAQQPNIVSISGQDPSTYQHRTVGTYINIGIIAYPFTSPLRSPSTSQSPSITRFPYQSPFTYIYQQPSIGQETAQSNVQTYVISPSLYPAEYRYPTTSQQFSNVQTPSIVGIQRIIQVVAQQPLGFEDVSVQNTVQTPSRAVGNTRAVAPQIYQQPVTAQISYRYTVQAPGIIPYSFNFRTLLIGYLDNLSIPAIYIARAIYVYQGSDQVLVPYPARTPSPYTYQNVINTPTTYPFRYLFRYPYTTPSIVRYPYLTGPKLQTSNQGLTASIVSIRGSTRGSTIGNTIIATRQPLNGITQASYQVPNGTTSPIVFPVAGRYAVSANYNFIFQQAYYFRQPTIGNGNISYPYTARTPARNLINIRTAGNINVQQPLIYQVPSRAIAQSPSIYINSIRSSYQQPAPYIHPIPLRTPSTTARVELAAQNPANIQFDTLIEVQHPSRAEVQNNVQIRAAKTGDTGVGVRGTIPLRTIANIQNPLTPSSIGNIPYSYTAIIQTPATRNKQTPYPYTIPNRSPFTYSLRSPFLYQNPLIGNTQITYPYRSPFTYQTTYQNTRPIGPIARVKDVYLNQGGIVNKAQEVYLNDSSIVKKIHDAE